MNISKIVLGFIVGASFTTLAAIICILATAYLTDYLDEILYFPLFLIAVAYVVFYAVISGGVGGMVVSALDFNLIKALLFGLIFNLFLGFVLLFLSGGGWDETMSRTYYVSIFIGTMNGAVVSLTIHNSNQTFNFNSSTL